MEEFFLGALFSADEVDVVDHEDVHFAVFGAELLGGLVHDALDQLIGELLRGNVADVGAWRFGEEFLSDGLHEVGFSQAGAAVEEQRVVCAAGGFRDGFRGGVGESVSRTDDKSVEGISRVEAVEGANGFHLFFGDGLVE